MIVLTFLAILLSIMLFIRLFMMKSSLHSPSVILMTMFLVTTIFSLIGNGYWNQDINPLIIVIFVVGVLLFTIGESIASKVNINIPVISIDADRIKRIYPYLLIFSLIGVVIQIFLSFKMMETANLKTNNIFEYVNNLRNLQFHYDIKTNYSLTIMYFMTQSIGYIGIYIYFSIRNRLQYLVLAILTLVSFFLTTSRDSILLFLIYSFIVYLVTQKRKIKYIVVFKYLTYIFFIFILFFSLSGLLRGFGTLNIWKTIVHYAGSANIAFSNYISTSIVASKNLGYESFVGIRDFIHRFNSSFDAGFKFLEFTSFTNGDSTNIYTGFRSLIADFGFAGMFLSMIILGIIFGILKASINHKNGLAIILYSYFVAQMSMFVFTPHITSNILSITQIFQLFWIYLFYKCMFLRRR